MISKALIIDEPWISKILSGEKTWEMRSTSTKIRGPIGLIRKGSGKVCAVVDLDDSLDPISSFSEMTDKYEYHQIPEEIIRRENYKWWTPWVMSNIRILPQEVSYRHLQGAVIWINVTPEVVKEISSQIGTDNDRDQKSKCSSDRRTLFWN